VHEPPGGIVSQVFVWLNSEIFNPVISTPLTVRSNVPVFVIVVESSGAPPTLTFPKLREVGLIDILGASDAKLKQGQPSVAANKEMNIVKGME
jgi:hypothetical protein